MRIAIADSDALRRNMIETTLRSGGYDVLSVSTPAEISLLAEMPDLAVVDASYISCVDSDNVKTDNTAGDHPLHIDKSRRMISLNGKRLRLTPKEYDLLSFLLTNTGKVFTRDELFRSVWDSDDDSDTRAVMVYIGRIRKKIERDPSNPEILINVWGSGYMLLN